MHLRAITWLLAAALLFLPSCAQAAAPLMAIQGFAGVPGAPSPGDNGFTVDNMPNAPNVTSGGAFTYTIPIVAPPGTHGMVPRVALSYSSQNGDGPEGIGWTISGLSQITRCPQTIAEDSTHGSVNFNFSDRFCLDGQRLILTSTGSYGAVNSQYHTEIESFRQITACGQLQGNGPQCFDVKTKDGMDYQYGYSTDTRILAADGSTVRIWTLHQVTDPNGNYITYSWNNYSSYGDYAIKEIDYTGTTTTGPYNSLQFTYVARNDLVPMYQAGLKITPHVLLSSITTNNGENLVWTYTPTYNQVNGGGASYYSNSWHNQLASLQVCDATGKNCLPTMNFTWQGGPNTWSMSSGTPRALSQGVTLQAGDFNGDGYTDALTYSYKTCPTSGEVWLWNGSKFTNSPSEQTTFDYWEDSGNKQTYSGNVCFYPYQGTGAGSPITLDFDGNGFTDLFLPLYDWMNNSWTLTTQALQNEPTTGTTGTLAQANGDGKLLYVSQLIGDFDGDGRDDYFNTATGTPYISDGKGGFNQDTSQVVSWSGNLLVGDFDGSGCAGLAQVNATQNVQYFFCQSAGGVVPVDIPSWWQRGSQFVLADFNGDGKEDILQIPPANCNASATLFLSTGTGVSAYTVSNSTTWCNYTVVAGDWNADGKADVLLISKKAGTSHAVYLSTGTDFIATSNSIANKTDTNDSAVIADWNSNGTSDIWLQRSTSSGGDTEFDFSYAPELLQKIDDNNGKVVTVCYDKLNGGSACGESSPLYTKGSGDKYPTQDVTGPIYVVSSITMSNGLAKGEGAFSWNYSYSDLTRNLQGLGYRGFATISVTDNQTGLVRTTNYNTTWPLYGLPASVTTCCTQSGSQNNLSSVAYTWSSTPLGSGSTYYFVALAKQSYSGEDYDGSAWPSTTTSYSYDDKSSPTCPNSGLYGNVFQKKFQVTDDGWQSTTTNCYNYDTADWIVNMPQSSSTANTPPTGSAITRTVDFAEAKHSWEISQAIVQPTSGDTTNLTANYGYDTFGNLASTQYMGSNIATRSSSVSYTSTTGEFPIQTTNALNQSENWAFAPYFGQPNTLTDLNGLTTTWATDTFGRPASLVRSDNTQVNVSYSYCNSSPTYKCASGHNAVFEAVTTHSGPASYGSVQNAPTTVVYYDALGRVVMQDTQSFDGSTWSRVATYYDTSGRVSLVSRPYFANVASESCTGGSVVCTSYTYDALNRVTVATIPIALNTTRVDTYGYHGTTTSVTVDSTGKSQTTTTVRNDEGLVASVTRTNNNSNWVTSYAYDAFGDPITISSPDGTYVQNWFDTLGRKYQSTDPDMGTWLYGYDNLGELTSQQSPNETTATATTLGYDVLGRLRTRSEPDMYSTWDYDKASYGVGFIDNASCGPAVGQPTIDACAGGTYSRSYSYDSLSRPSSISIQYGSGTPYHSNETYDPTTGLLTGVTDFAGLPTTDVYNTQGYLAQITDSGGDNYWKANTVDAEDGLQEETEGSGAGKVVTQRGFDPFTHALESIVANTPNANNDDTIVNFTYGWDAIGNLTSRTDNIQTYTENFCYDALNRLVNYAVIDGGGTSCSSGTIVKSIGYDENLSGGIGDGNITTKSDIGGYTYGIGAGPHAVTSINTTATGGCTRSSCQVDGVSNPTFGYDPDGNMLCVTSASSCSQGTPARSYSWTSFDMASSIVRGGATSSTFGYTPEHQRGSLTSASGTLYYFSNPVAGVFNELAPGSTPNWRSYESAGGHIAAELFSNGQQSITRSYFFVGDHLGSTVSLSDPTGTQDEYDSYDAWGNRRYASGSDFPTGCFATQPSSFTLRGFSGQEEMDSFCLVNLNARLYDPALGRVLSADPTVPDAMNGQAFNRYAYVTNNPVSLTDPSGDTPVFGGVVHIICVNSCGANDMDPSESMVDSNYFGAEGSQSLVGIFSGDYSLLDDPSSSANGPITPPVWIPGPGDECESGSPCGQAEPVDQASATSNSGSVAPPNFGQQHFEDQNVTNGGIQNASWLLGDHDYNTAHVICPAAWNCSASLVGRTYSQIRNGIPGNTSAAPIVSGTTYTVYLIGVPVGQVQSYVGRDGLTVDNVTAMDHILFDGWANRNAIQVDGTWYSITHGSGTNYYGGAVGAEANQLFGPDIFNDLDMSIEGQLYTATH